MKSQEKAERFWRDSRRELSEAQLLYPVFNSAHEAFAVILEEIEEFKAEVWRKQPERDPVRMYRELVQIAAMAARAACDLELPERNLTPRRKDAEDK